MNRGGVGARSLNIELQAALNPAGDCKVERFGWTFAPGDKVMQIENDYDKEVYNGDIGHIDNVARPSDLPSTPTGRLAAMESRVKVMLQSVQTVRPPLQTQPGPIPRPRASL